MSINAHLEALRHGTTSHLERATFELSDAGQRQLLGDELKDASRVPISGLLSERDVGNDRTICLPDELLALCFTFLPFRGRVFVSHVSRRWRSVSLNNPEIWAYDLPRSHPPALFAMALNRTGSLPVDVLDCPDPDQHDGIQDLLVNHMHHIRSLYYPRVLHSAPLSCPAPFLETFVCNAGDPVSIGVDFLGGTIGRLRKLQLRTVSFPKKCPALSTVTELFVDGPTSLHHGNFSLLFELFPVLRSLTLTNLKRSVSGALPTGPLPAVLQSLNMYSNDPDYDLSHLYATWRSDALRSVDIGHSVAVSKYLVHLVEGAHTIEVQHDVGYQTSVISALGPGSRDRKLEYWEDDADQRDLAAHLLEIPSALCSVSSMSVPASSLEAFIAVFAVLPELARITVVIDAPHAPAAASSWSDVLEPLAQLKRRGNLQSLVLHVDYVGALSDPSAHDAEGLLAQLATLAHVPLPDITVTGFPPAILLDVALDGFSGFRVVFASTDEPAPARSSLLL